MSRPNLMKGAGISQRLAEMIRLTRPGGVVAVQEVDRVAVASRHIPPGIGC
jgi:hypothetical protein